MKGNEMLSDYSLIVILSFGIHNSWPIETFYIALGHVNLTGNYCYYYHYYYYYYYYYY